MNAEVTIPAEGQLTLDVSGEWPALMAHVAGRRVAMSSRRNPIVDADRLLTAVLGDRRPPVITLIGLGLGWILDALDRRQSTARVLAFEPLTDAVPFFLARRDWSSWLGTGRLRLVAGPEYHGAQYAWAALAPQAVPPVIVDPGLLAAHSALVAPARAAVWRARYGSALDPRLVPIAQSMLHVEARTMMEHAAATASGAVVEIGAYVGGATMVMATGIRDSGRATPMFTVELGGQHAHPQLPSTDIFGDLQKNLRRQGLERFVTLMQGRSTDPGVLQSIRAALAARRMSIGVLVIDADGQVERDFDAYLPLCSDGCILIVDDYTTPQENSKVEPTRRAVDALVTSGRAHAIGVFGWGTWFGVYTPSRANARVAAERIGVLPTG